MAEMAPEDQMPAPASAAGDLSQGYCVELHVLPDGSFGVSGPEPLSEEKDEGENPEGDKQFPKLEGALRALLAIVKANPVAQDENAQVEAGYQE